MNFQAEATPREWSLQGAMISTHRYTYEKIGIRYVKIDAYGC